MNKLRAFPVLFLLFGGFLTVAAQTEPADQTAPAPKRAGLLAQLNLTREQIQQIREINQRNRPQIREANQRLRLANRSLDAAIYGDAANEADVQLKVSEVHAAHAEVVRLRTETEYAVRKILNAEQLARFREIREQSLAEKQMLPRLRNRPLSNPNRPLNNLQRRNRPLN